MDQGTEEGSFMAHRDASIFRNFGSRNDSLRSGQVGRDGGMDDSSTRGGGEVGPRRRKGLRMVQGMHPPPVSSSSSIPSFVFFSFSDESINEWMDG